MRRRKPHASYELQLAVLNLLMAGNVATIGQLVSLLWCQGDGRWRGKIDAPKIYDALDRLMEYRKDVHREVHCGAAYYAHRTVATAGEIVVVHVGDRED